MGAHDGACPALNVIMLGPPGAGKGTQAERIARARGIPKISTGDILRDAVQTGTKLGVLARKAMEAGNLVGDDLMIGIVEERLVRGDTECGFVLDGFPRTVVQAIELDRIIDGRGPLLVVQIVVPEDVLVRRLATRRICSKCGANAEPDHTDACAKCGGTLVTRVDDSLDIVRERLKVYLRQTEPLVDYYSPRSSFRSIDGNQVPEVVTTAVAEALETISRKVVL